MFLLLKSVDKWTKVSFPKTIVSSPNQIGIHFIMSPFNLHCLYNTQSHWSCIPFYQKAISDNPLTYEFWQQSIVMPAYKICDNKFGLGQCWTIIQGIPWTWSFISDVDFAIECALFVTWVIVDLGFLLCALTGALFSKIVLNSEHLCNILGLMIFDIVQFTSLLGSNIE